MLKINQKVTDFKTVEESQLQLVHRYNHIQFMDNQEFAVRKNGFYNNLEIVVSKKNQNLELLTHSQPLPQPRVNPSLGG